MLLILFLFIILFFLILISKFKVIVNKIKISNLNRKLYIEYDVWIKIYIVKFVKIYTIKLNQQQSKNLIKKISIKDLKVNKVPNIQELKRLKGTFLKFKNIKLYIDVGIENINLTVYLNVLVSILTSILLRNNSNNKYSINPIYNMGNKINIDFSGISEIKAVHIIYIIYLLKKTKN